MDDAAVRSGYTGPRALVAGPAGDIVLPMCRVTAFVWGIRGRAGPFAKPAWTLKLSRLRADEAVSLRYDQSEE